MNSKTSRLRRRGGWNKEDRRGRLLQGLGSPTTRVFIGGEKMVWGRIEPPRRRLERPDGSKKGRLFARAGPFK